MSTIVLDSWALMAYFAREPEGRRVWELIREGRQGLHTLLVSVVNLGEVRYRIRRLRGPDAAEAACRIVSALGIEVVQVGQESAFAAADLKADTPVAFADCFAAALARLRDGQVATGDPEFRKFGDRVKVLWLGDPHGAGDS
jgi:predicted nucleic acid-binding protein